MPVRDKYLISTYGQKILDAGFYALPNLILDYQTELDLTDEELVFYIKVTHFYTRRKVDMENLRMSHKRSALFMIRKKLIDKGYLEVLRTGNRVVYDWSGLIEKINWLVEKRREIENPKSGLENPKSGLENPKSGLENPKSGLENPKSGLENPKSGLSSLYREQRFIKEQQQEGDVVVVKKRLLEIGMTERIADELIGKFDLDSIKEKLEYCEANWKDWKVNNPAGWLRKAIEQDWKLGENVKKKQALIEKAKERYEQIKKMVKEGR